MDMLVRAYCVCMRMYVYVCEYVKAGGSGSLNHSVTVARGEQTSLSAG